jgi:1-acyl-sn-glycerol-3-phosphate acyltransferase
MKLIWYLFVKIYVRLGFAFYFKKIHLVGIENIPKKRAILFVSNHQNALIDPLLIGAFTPRELHFLTRADIFEKPLIRALLSTVNMLPIYRMGDGMNSLQKNEKIFKECYTILGKNGTVLIFPEGNHNIKRRVRVLSKGFTRIVFGALENNPELEIDIVPIGINYTNAKKYASSVSIWFGKPIAVNPYYTENETNGASTDLKNTVREAMKKLVSHIENQEDHDQIVKSFREEEFLFPERVNQKLNSKKDLEPLDHKVDNAFNFLTPIVKFNSLFPLLIWKYVYPKISEQEFIATFRYTIGITFFPIFYLLQSWFVYLLLGSNYALTYLLFSFLSVFLFTKSK